MKKYFDCSEMKMNPHSLEYKRQKAPNKKYKDLKQKQKALIADWMFERTCQYYREFGSMPTEDDSRTIIKEVFKKIENSAIWVPFEAVYSEYLKKIPRYEVRIRERGIPEEILDPKPKKPKVGKKVRKPKRKQKKKEKAELLDNWQDDDFFFIAGYTSGGAPYGVTWEEMELEPWQDSVDM